MTKPAIPVAHPPFPAHDEAPRGGRWVDRVEGITVTKNEFATGERSGRQLGGRMVGFRHDAGSSVGD